MDLSMLFGSSPESQRAVDSDNWRTFIDFAKLSLDTKFQIQTHFWIISHDVFNVSSIFDL